MIDQQKAIIAEVAAKAATDVYVAQMEGPTWNPGVWDSIYQHIGAAIYRSATGQAPTAAPPPNAPEPAPSGSAIDAFLRDPRCPKCSSPMRDDRATRKNPKAPDFKCTNKECMDGEYRTGLYLDRLTKSAA